MAVSIRMRRTGANKDISFRVVAADSRSPRDGKCLEILGWYDPKHKGDNFQLKLDRIEYWMSKGAKVSATILSLMKKARAGAKPPA